MRKNTSRENRCSAICISRPQVISPLFIFAFFLLERQGKKKRRMCVKEEARAKCERRRAEERARARRKEHIKRRSTSCVALVLKVAEADAH